MDVEATEELKDEVKKISHKENLMEETKYKKCSRSREQKDINLMIPKKRL